MLKTYKGTTKSRRFMSRVVSPESTDVQAPRKLKTVLKKHAGRSRGQITVRGQSGRHKRYYREIDFKRNKYNIFGEILSLEYDPNRSVNIALVKYSDGEHRYILACEGLQIGNKIVAGERVEVSDGNAMRLKNMPIGTIVHNVELTPGKGGQIGRSAGTGLHLLAKEAGFAHLKMPSGEVRMISLESMATIGKLGNEDWRSMVIGKAGRSRHMGIKPKVRGTAMDPNSHPHGGGEGRSGVGRKKPMTVYGKPAVGKTRKRNKWTSKYIVRGRKNRG